MPIDGLRLDYCAEFGLDPEQADPEVTALLAWGQWRTAKASKQVYADKKRMTNWEEQMTADQKRLLVWAIEKDSDG